MNGTNKLRWALIAVGVVAVFAVGFPASASPDAPNPGHAWTELENHGTAGAPVDTYYLGTTTDDALEFRVYDARALRLEPNAITPNVIGGHFGNTVTSGVYGATIGGGGESGYPNTVTDNFGTVGGGGHNQAGDAAGTQSDAEYATVAGGMGNEATATYAAVNGGYANEASAYAATVGGGGSNKATDEYGTIGGGSQNQAGDADANPVSARWATVGGGSENHATAYFTTVGGGELNTATAFYATVGGGSQNQAAANYATIGGGGSVTAADGNRVYDDWGTVGGGEHNEAGINNGNPANETHATVGGGSNNSARGQYATVPGGMLNNAYGAYSFAAGRRAMANTDGSFVWADSQDADFMSDYVNQFKVRAFYGSYFTDGSGLWVEMNRLLPIDTSTTAYLSAGGVWTNASDAALKENFSAADPQQVLASLATIPIATWNYRAEDVDTLHMGPTGQDFYAAFALGDGERAISTVDADGVALAAIQGLYELSQEQAAEIAALKTSCGGGPSASAGDSQTAPASGLPTSWLALSALVLAALAVAVCGLVLAQRRLAGGQR